MYLCDHFYIHLKCNLDLNKIIPLLYAAMIIMIYKEVVFNYLQNGSQCLFMSFGCIKGI